MGPIYIETLYMSQTVPFYLHHSLYFNLTYLFLKNLFPFFKILFPFFHFNPIRCLFRVFFFVFVFFFVCICVSYTHFLNGPVGKGIKTKSVAKRSPMRKNKTAPNKRNSLKPLNMHLFPSTSKIQLPTLKI